MYERIPSADGNRSNILLARRALANICETDSASVTSSTELATRLQGVSRAMLTLIRANATPYAPTPEMLSLQEDLEPPQPQLQHLFLEADLRDRGGMVGRLLSGRMVRDQDAHLSVSRIDLRGRGSVSYYADVPSDQHIRRLLDQEPCLWEDTTIYARDFRDGSAPAMYPFHYTLADDTAQPRYLQVVQDLSADLLAAAAA